MSDYTNIKRDCNECHKGLEHAIRILARIIDISREPDDDWGISMDGPQAENLVEFLKGVSGLLHHLGNERDAAGALLRQHQPTFENPYGGSAA